MKAHHKLCSATIVVGLLASLCALGPSQQQALISLDDMEGDVAERWRDLAGTAKTTLEPDEQIVKEGEQSGRWDPAVSAQHIYLALPETARNWEALGALEMWVHSEKATGAIFAVVVQSENPDTDGEDYYRCLIPVDWEGWRFLHLEPRSFVITRQPLGWRHVDTLRFAIAGWNDLKYVQGTVLRFDALRLAGPADDPERRILFDPDTDWCAWWPLTYAVTPTKTGRYVAEWFPSEKVTRIRNQSIPHDWSGRTHLNLWLHCQDVMGAALRIGAVSDRPATNEFDSYRATIALNWDGWRLLSVPLADFKREGDPVGWQAIGQLELAVSWPGDPKPEARICLDDMWLSTQAETEATWAARHPAAATAQTTGPTPAPSIAAPLRDTDSSEQAPNPQEIARLLNEALAAKRAGDLELSFTKYIAVLLADPGNIEAHWGLAWLLAIKGETEAATEHFQKVIELSDDADRVREAQAAVRRLKVGGNE